MHLAVESGHAECAVALIEGGADRDRGDSEGSALLSLCVNLASRFRFDIDFGLTLWNTEKVAGGRDRRRRRTRSEKSSRVQSVCLPLSSFYLAQVVTDGGFSFF